MIAPIRTFFKNSNVYSFFLLFGSTFCLITATFLIIDGFQCHCHGYSPVKGGRTCKSCINSEGEPGMSFEAITGWRVLIFVWIRHISFGYPLDLARSWTTESCSNLELLRLRFIPSITKPLFLRIGAVNIVLGMMFAALWRDSIDVELLTQKQEQKLTMADHT